MEKSRIQKKEKRVTRREFIKTAGKLEVLLPHSPYRHLFAIPMPRAMISSVSGLSGPVPGR